MNNVKRTERGWAGHFIGGGKCEYHRNTLLEYDGNRVIVSTVGRWLPDFIRHDFMEIADGRFFETMAFTAEYSNDGYWDANCYERVMFESDWTLPRPDMEKEADEMHEKAVAEIAQHLLNNTLKVESYDYDSH